MIKFNSNPNQICLSSNLQIDSVVDGPGIRTVIWTQGCIHNCPGCHNPSTHAFNAGMMFDIDTICKNITLIYQNITFSGGDPFLQSKQCAKIASYAKSIGLTVWAYTGFTFEDLVSMNDNDVNDFLSCIDVLVDGRFELANKTMECAYRGSSNQRLIDVPLSINTKKIIQWKNPYELFTNPVDHNLI